MQPNKVDIPLGEEFNSGDKMEGRMKTTLTSILCVLMVIILNIMCRSWKCSEFPRISTQERHSSSVFLSESEFLSLTQPVLRFFIIRI